MDFPSINSSLAAKITSFQALLSNHIYMITPAQHRKWHQDLPKVQNSPGRSSFPFCVIGSVVTFHFVFLTQIEVPRIRMRLTTMNMKYVVKGAFTLHEFFLEVYYSVEGPAG